jgi:hypothetical protein
LLAYYFVIRPVSVALDRISSAQATNNARLNDYQTYTTPLSKETVADICLKFGIEETSEYCKDNAIVYAPEIFPEIERYFKNLPGKTNIVPIVDEKLVAYLISCNATSKATYECKYDLRGDGRYLLYIVFTKDGYLYRILMPRGGSS